MGLAFSILYQSKKAKNRAVLKGPAADPRLADPVAAIAFALTVDDPYNAIEFLRAWNVGDLQTLDEWPQFKGGRDDKEQRRDAERDRIERLNQTSIGGM